MSEMETAVWELKARIALIGYRKVELAHWRSRPLNKECQAIARRVEVDLERLRHEEAQLRRWLDGEE